MPSSKVYYIISDLEKSIAFEWISEHIDQEKVELGFILLNPKESHLESSLAHSHHCYRIEQTGRLGNVRALFNLYRILRREKPDAVHCHLRRANLIGLTASYFAGVKKRIYTRHFSTYNLRYFPSAVKYDRLVNRLSTDIVAISKNVLSVLLDREQVKAEKTHLIRHGFDLSSFEQVGQDRINVIRKRWKIDSNKTVIGVISRFIEWKGIQHIIPAFKELITEGVDAQLVLANASGPYQKHLLDLMRDIPKERIRLITFESDLQALYRSFDYYVHVPIDPHIEAFGQTYVETLASGIPSVVTMSGIGHEIINHEVNALVVPHENSAAIKSALSRLMKDKELCSSLIQNGKKSITEFDLQGFINKLETLYGH